MRGRFGWTIRDLQIVKTYGRAVGYLKHKGQQFPKFETYRENIDGKYWFPTYTYADDVLNFATGPQRIKVMVQYKDYKKFGSDVNIKFGDNPVDVSAVNSSKSAKSAETAPVNRFRRAPYIRPKTLL